MAINKLNIGLISNTASDGNEGVTDQHVLTYVAANNSVEFKELSLTVAGVGTVSSNADAVNTQLTANIDTVQDNVTSTISLLSSSNTNIDTVQANLDTFAAYANTNYAADAANSFSTITVGDANVVAATATDNVIFATGNGISILANADAQSLTFSMYAGDIKSDYFTLDGTSNTVTLSTDNRPEYTLYVTVGGLIQEPGINYVVSSTTLTLNNTYPILNGTDVEVRYLPYTGEIATVAAGSSSNFQGTSFGYTMGQHDGTASTDVITKTSFTSDSPSVDVGELTYNGTRGSGHHSDTYGYVAGGRLPTSSTDAIEKTSFSSDSSSIDIAELANSIDNNSGTMTTTHGYLFGGFQVQASPQETYGKSFQKFPFSSDSPGSQVTSDLGVGTIKGRGAGIASPDTMYFAGARGNISPTGTPTSPAISQIFKVPGSSDSTATVTGDLTAGKYLVAGSNSTENGYVHGGFQPGLTTPASDQIEKFPFSSDTNATDIAELAYRQDHTTGSSSTTHGYNLSGRYAGPTGTPADPTLDNSIQKYPFASDSPATDIAEFTSGFNAVGNIQT
jgi:hypothetical protein